MCEKWIVYLTLRKRNYPKIWKDKLSRRQRNFLSRFISSFAIREKLWHHTHMLDSGDLVVKSNEIHWIIHLFNILDIFHFFKKLEYHRLQNFINNIDLRKLDIEPFLFTFYLHKAVTYFRPTLFTSLKLHWICLHCLNYN